LDTKASSWSRFKSSTFQISQNVYVHAIQVVYNSLDGAQGKLESNIICGSCILQAAFRHNHFLFIVSDLYFIMSRQLSNSFTSDTTKYTSPYRKCGVNLDRVGNSGYTE
jgi:hypothetical protein